MGLAKSATFTSRVEISRIPASLSTFLPPNKSSCKMQELIGILLTSYRVGLGKTEGSEICCLTVIRVQKYWPEVLEVCK